MGIFQQFPYTNFHEMNLDEIIKIVKQLADEWVEYQTKWGNLYSDTEQALQDFKDYVYNYFDTLDLQDEVNKKINDMVLDGTFDQIITTDLSPVVTDWLDANITLPVGVVIDKSLSTEDAAADAKAVGDAVKTLNGVTGKTPATFTLNGYIKTNENVGSAVTMTPVSANSDYSYAVVNCNPGDIFTVAAQGGNAPRAWAFVDNSDILISKANNAAEMSGDTLVAPDGAAKLIINNIVGTHDHYVFKGVSLSAKDADFEETYGKGVFNIGAEDFPTGKVLHFAYDNVDSADILVPDRELKVNTAYSETLSGSRMSARTEFVPASGYFVISVMCGSSASTTNFTLFVRIKKLDNTYAWKTIQPWLTIGDVTNITVDLSHLAVYENAAEVSFIIESYNSASVSREITLQAYPYVSKYKDLTTFGATLGEWLQNLNNASGGGGGGGSISAGSRQFGFMVSPNGTKYVEQINNAGTQYVVPVIPTRTIFIGNSLLVGFNNFGMCASDDTKDYRALFTNYVNSLGGSMTYAKLSGVDWETAATLALKEAWVSTNINSALLSGADLVVVQLGDNSSGAQSSFYYDACINMLRAIRQIVPNARVCWMGSWYSQSLMDYVKAACDSCGATFIDIRDLVTAANKGYYGQIVDWGSVRMFEYSNITSYTDNGDGTITFTFTADGNSYTVTIPFTNVVDDGVSVKIWSDEYVVTTSGVAGHPGDRGFRAMTKKMLYDLFISDFEETYTLA